MTERTSAGLGRHPTVLSRLDGVNHRADRAVSGIGIVTAFEADRTSEVKKGSCTAGSSSRVRCRPGAVCLRCG